MLNDVQIRKAKAKEKAYKLADGNGLYLYVSVKGYKSWRYDYSFKEKRKTFTIGEYPAIPLAEARIRHREIKIKLSNGIDPQAEAQAEKEAIRSMENNSFEVVAFEWYAVKKEDWRESHATKQIQLLKRDILPFLAAKQINAITVKEVLGVLKRLEERGLRDTVIRAKGILSQIFCYGVATGRCEYDVTSGLKGVFKKPHRQHFTSLTEETQIKQFLIDLDTIGRDNKRVSLFTLLACKMIMYTLTRSQEVCKAEWKEFDFNKNLWTIPAEHKKENRGHTVPLSRQVIAILEELRPYTEHTGFLFPSDRSRQGHITGESLSKFLREILGYRDKQTIHGLRSMGSTLLNETLKHNYDVIEKALAHKDTNDIRAIYNRAEYLEARKSMLQEYADYLDNLKNGGE